MNRPIVMRGTLLAQTSLHFQPRFGNGCPNVIGSSTVGSLTVIRFRLTLFAPAILLVFIVPLYSVFYLKKNLIRLLLAYFTLRDELQLEGVKALAGNSVRSDPLHYREWLP